MVMPESPDGARESGIVVAGITRTDDPEMRVVEKGPGPGAGGLKTVVITPLAEVGGGGFRLAVGAGD